MVKMVKQELKVLAETVQSVKPATKVLKAKQVILETLDKPVIRVEEVFAEIQV